MIRSTLVVAALLLESAVAGPAQAQRGVANLDIVPQVGHSGAITAVAFSADESMLATGGTEIKLWDTATGILLRTFEPREPVRELRFDMDDGQLQATGAGGVETWPLDYGSEPTFTPSAGATAPASARPRHGMVKSPSGRWAVLLVGGRGRLLDTEGDTLRPLPPNAGAPPDLAFSTDGLFLAAGSFGQPHRLWDLSSLGLVRGDESRAKELIRGLRPVTSAERARIAALDPDLGEPTAVAVSRAGTTAAIASGRDVHVHDLVNGGVITELRMGAEVRKLAFSPDAHLLASADAEGIRLTNLGTGYWAMLLAIGGEWLVVDRDGYFDASRRGGELVAAIQYVSGRVTPYRIDQLANVHNRPDLLLERLGLGSAEVRGHYRARHERRLRKLGLDESGLEASFASLPAVTITDVKVRGKRAEVRFQARGRWPLRSYALFVNDVPLYGLHGRPVSGDQAELSDIVALSAGRNRIEVSVLDAAGGESLRAVREVTYDGAAPGDLYYLGFGVSRYRDARLDLAYAAKDALDLEHYARSLRGHFRQVRTRTYVDDQVTVANLRKARRFLAGAGVDDTVILFVAGHGTHSSDAAADYFFVTHETDPDHLRETAASFTLLEELLIGIPARRKLFLMDTCESGERDDGAAAAALPTPSARGLRARTTRAFRLRPAAGVPVRPRPWLLDRERFIEADLIRRTGAIVFSSSLGAEYSYELDAARNGAFTRGLKSALTGDGDADGDGEVSTDELRAYLAREVSRLTDGRQHPTVDRDNRSVLLRLPVARRLQFPGERGCGCTAGGDPGGLILVLLGLLATTRLRRPARPCGAASACASGPRR